MATPQHTAAGLGGLPPSWLRRFGWRSQLACWEPDIGLVVSRQMALSLAFRAGFGPLL